MNHTSKAKHHEILQAYVRIFVLVAIITSFIIFKPSYLENINHTIILSIFSLFAILHIHSVFHQKFSFFQRRTSAIITDLALTIYTMYTLNLEAIILYPLVVWIILGNGVRFGTKYLYIALCVAIVFLSIAITYNTTWLLYPGILISLIIGLFAISFLTLSTIKNLHTLNSTLEEKVSNRVEELKYEYLHDSLTGLFNRFSLEQDLRNDPFGGLMVIDIDSFRNINELYGMHTGNEILKEIGGYLQNFFDKKDFHLYRIYGDVFAAKSKLHYIDHDLYESVVQDLLLYIDTITINSKEMNTSLNVDITIGLSLEEEDALNKAEMALSFAKANMKKFIAYSKMIDTSHTIHQLLQCKDEIKEAIHENNFIPVFQPIVNRDQTIIKYEALIRMRKYTDGKEELVSPYFFLETAIKTKQYETLTIIMIEKSFKIMQELGKSFSLNLSFNDLINENVLKALKTNIAHYNIGHQLTLEILESENIEDYQVINNFIKEFKTFGVEIAIDDFGSGFSNFTHVFELEPDILKIDGSLIKNIDKDQKSYEFVKSIVGLAHTLGIKTLAEFVSSKEIFDITYTLGVDYFQGYYFSEPISHTLVHEQNQFPASQDF